MARKVSARRYSQAVFEIALETQKSDQWQADLKKVAGVAEDSALRSWLENPRLHFEDKAKLLSGRLKGINPLALNLSLLLVAKGRLGMIGDIADDYQRRLDSHRGIESAEVITAIPLDDRDKAKLTEHLGALIGKKVVLKSEVDPDVIGGVIARIGGKLLDGSTRSKLLALRKELVGAGK
ncbi:ATP synthase F1 subunit delta [Chloroflexota bacterium]